MDPESFDEGLRACQKRFGEVGSEETPSEECGSRDGDVGVLFG